MEETALHWAAMMGSSEIVQLLLAAKGNVNAENMVSDSLLQICAELCGLDCCRPSKLRCTMLLQEEIVSQCSYYSLQRAMLVQ